MTDKARATTPTTAATATGGNNKTKSNSNTNSHVLVDPYYISFPPPHTGRCIQTSLMVANPTGQPCVFKLATARPELFVVRPHMGLLAGRSGVRVRITLRDTTGATPLVTPDTTVLFRVMAKPVTHNAELLAADAHTTGLRLARQVWAHEAHTARTAVDVVAYFTAAMPPLPSAMVTFLPANHAAPVAAARGASQAGRGDVRRSHETIPNNNNNTAPAVTSTSVGNNDNNNISTTAACTGLVEDPVEGEDEELELPLDDALPAETAVTTTTRTQTCTTEHHTAASNERRAAAGSEGAGQQCQSAPRRSWLPLLMGYAVLPALVVLSALCYMHYRPSLHRHMSSSQLHNQPSPVTNVT